MNHPTAWLIWALAAAVPALLIRNPLYLVIIGLAAWLVFVAASQDASQEKSWMGLLKMGILVWVLTIPFNALMIHQGTHVLFRLPLSWPLVGGNITLEAVLYGVVSGLALWVLLLIFAAMNAAMDTSQLLRLTPSFLYQAGVVTSIALTFMPQMFERAILLAESMESRGFGGQLTTQSPSEANRTRVNMVLGLLLLLCGLFLYGYMRTKPGLGIALLAVAALILVSTFASLGRRVQRSHYRRLYWSSGDRLVSVLSLGVMLLVLIIRARDGLALTYYPYPPYPLLPEFNGGIGLILALLAIPGFVTLFGEPGSTALAPVPNSEDLP
jgi:energy-coupling factor transport system permease protein